MIRMIIVAVLTLVVSFGADARKVPGEKVGVTFGDIVYDFGTVKADAPEVEHAFTFKVTGDNAVAILYAQPSCGCTASDYPRQPVKAGEESAIKIKFNPAGQRGEVDKTVRVRLKSGDGKSENLTLRVRGVVVPAK